MMQGNGKMGIAVRRANGEIVLKTEKLSVPEEWTADGKLVLQSVKRAEKSDMTVLRFCECIGGRGKNNADI